LNKTENLFEEPSTKASSGNRINISKKGITASGAAAQTLAKGGAVGLAVLLAGMGLGLCIFFSKSNNLSL
jgi:hypothetical protein